MIGGKQQFGNSGQVRASRRSMLVGGASVFACAALATSAAVRAAAMPDARLFLLGTQGGPNYSQSRAESSSALQVGGHLYLIDCGYGTRAAMAKAGLNDRALDAIFLTHLHDDHTSDLLTILTHAATQGRARDLVVYGPRGTHALVQGIREALTPNAIIRLADEARPAGFLSFIKSVEAEPGAAIMEQDGVRVTCAENTHYPKTIEGLDEQQSIALRFDWGRSIVFSGDTTYSDGLIALARDADVFVCEVLEPVAMRKAFDAMVAGGAFAGAEEGVWRHMVDTHSSPDQVGRMAAAAGVKQVVLSHLAPGSLLEIPDSDFIGPIAAHFNGPVVVGRDGMILLI